MTAELVRDALQQSAVDFGAALESARGVSTGADRAGAMLQVEAAVAARTFGSRAASGRRVAAYGGWDCARSGGFWCCRGGRRGLRAADGRRRGLGGRGAGRGLRGFGRAGAGCGERSFSGVRLGPGSGGDRGRRAGADDRREQEDEDEDETIEPSFGRLNHESSPRSVPDDGNERRSLIRINRLRVASIVSRLPSWSALPQIPRRHRCRILEKVSNGDDLCLLDLEEGSR